MNVEMGSERVERNPIVHPLCPTYRSQKLLILLVSDTLYEVPTWTRHEKRPWVDSKWLQMQHFENTEFDVEFQIYILGISLDPDYLFRHLLLWPKCSDQLSRF